eukprot:876893-Amphidinium_carterae.2
MASISTPGFHACLHARNTKLWNAAITRSFSEGGHFSLCAFHHSGMQLSHWDITVDCSPGQGSGECEGTVKGRAGDIP